MALVWWLRASLPSLVAKRQAAEEQREAARNAAAAHLRDLIRLGSAPRPAGVYAARETIRQHDPALADRLDARAPLSDLNGVDAVNWGVLVGLRDGEGAASVVKTDADPRQGLPTRDVWA